VIELGYVLSKRDFCFVKDGVRGHIHACLFGQPGEMYVYGYGETISMLDWYNKIIQIGQEEGLWGEKTLKADAEGRGRLGKSEVEELRVDYAKLNRLTGWAPRYSWEDGLRETVRWFAEHRQRWIGRVDWMKKGGK
jgi:dTDP-glucose 4,6-dehydratase